MWDIPQEIFLLEQDLSELVTRKEDGGIITEQDKQTAMQIYSALEDIPCISATEDLLDLGTMQEWLNIIIK